MSKNYWSVRGNVYQLTEPSPVEEELKPGIYELDIYNTMIGYTFCLKYIEERFRFNYKIYDKDESFIDRTIKTFANVKGNLGILLNGVKGTGKTVTGKIIANYTNLPVIIVKEKHDHIPTIINSIQQDIVVFIDEYDKIYSDTEGLLTLLDGVIVNKYKRLFIFTTNSLNVSHNLIERPSRIRYIKTYGNLEKPIITEIVSDLIDNKAYIDGVVKFISTLQTITIDIVKVVVTEVNIHDEFPHEFKDVLNIRVNVPLVNIYRIEIVDGTEVEYFKECVEINSVQGAGVFSNLVMSKYNVMKVNGRFETSNYRYGHVISREGDLLTVIDWHANNCNEVNKYINSIGRNKEQDRINLSNFVLAKYRISINDRINHVFEEFSDEDSNFNIYDSKDVNRNIDTDDSNITKLSY